MARKVGRKRTEKTPQLVVRISGDLDRYLRRAAEGLGLDLSGLVRMMLTENVGEYIGRGCAANKRVKAALAKPADSEDPPNNLFQGERSLDV